MPVFRKSIIKLISVFIVLAIVVSSCKKNNETLYDHFVSDEYIVTYNQSAIEYMMDIAAQSYSPVSSLKSYLDMLRAIKEGSDTEIPGISIKNEYYLPGYSQGGWATLCLHKAMELDHIFFGHGQVDTDVNVSTTETMYDEMINAGTLTDFCKEVLYPGLDHGGAFLPCITDGLLFLLNIKNQQDKLK